MKDELFHYSSPYYDPVKAHEYYMEHRKLKGRRSTAKLSEEGKKVWSYTKKEITAEKKGKVTQEQEKRNQKIENLREKAQVKRAEISERLKALSEALSKKAKTKKEQALEDTQAEIERLKSKKIPEGISEEARARLITKRNEKIARLRGDLSETKSDISESTQQEKQEARSDASEERQQVAVELKSAIAAAREAYTLAKQSLDTSYEDIFQREYDKILSEMPKLASTRKSKKASKPKYKGGKLVG